ncbi:uncharacterized protein PG986_010637 [Apiospora aurea]|uniref:ABM domain-containing protein n=1 Tax=Apiospora aurea TaxID=335848 RepID=A0ABR1Q383_9PEZI
MAPLGVVDADLGVYGVKRLKVADLNVCRRTPSANCANTAMTNAEKAADSSSTSPSRPRRTSRPALPAAVATLTQQPGCRGARYSRHHEDAAKLTLYVDWDSVAAHEQFCAKTDLYAPFVASLAPLSTTAPAPYHVAFEPPAKGVLDVAPAVEVLHLNFPADYGAEKQGVVLKKFGEFFAISEKAAGAQGMDLLVGSPAVGWAVEEREFKEEKARVLVVMIGWKSVEAHMQYRDTDAFRESIGMIRGLEAMKGISVYHVACAKA